MIFSKKIEPRCQYCEFGKMLNDQKVVCIKKGVMSPTSHCRKFRYDPLKRLPPRPISLDFSRHQDDDFTL